MPSTSAFQAGLARPQTINWSMCAQDVRTAGAACGDVVRIGDDCGDLHEILDSHSGSTQLSPQVSPCQGGLCLGTFRGAAVGRYANLSADVEGSADPLTSIAWVYWPAGAGASAALMSRRCMSSPPWVLVESAPGSPN